MSPRLRNVGVVITRPRAAAEALAAALEREGARPIVFPALAIEDIAPSGALQAALALLPRAALAIFVSANAVRKGLEAATRGGPWPGEVRVAAIGDATAEALRNSGFKDVISPPDRHDSEALLGLAPLQREVLQGCDVVVFRGEGGRERLREELVARGARVAYAECYRRVRPVSDARPLVEAWRRGEVQAVSALSAETLENFVAMLGAANAGLLAHATLVVPHEAIGRHRDARHFARVLVAPHGTEGFIDTLSTLQAAA
jgi:uroporphyrinogen-III synthase